MFKLKSQITLSIFLMSVISALTIGLYSWGVYGDAILKDALIKLEYDVQSRWIQLNQDVLDVISGRELLSRYVSNSMDMDALKTDPSYMENYKKQLRPIVESVAQSNASLSAYVYFDPTIFGAPDSVWYADMDRDGNVELQDEFTMDYYNSQLPNREWFYTPLKTGKPNWTLPYKGNMYYNEDITFISHTGPVKLQGSTVAVVGVDYYLDKLVKQVKQIKLPNSQYALLLDGDLKTLVHPDVETGIYFPDLSSENRTELIKSLIYKNTGNIEFQLSDDKVRVLSFRKLDNGWIFGYVLFRDEVMKGLNELRNLILWLLTAVVVVSILFSLYFSWIISRPVEHLSDTVIGIGNGNYNIEIDQKAMSIKNEVGALALAVDKMRIQLLDDFEKIENQNQILEDTVKERTTELQQVNEELESSMDNLLKSQNQLVISEKISALGYMISSIAHELNTPLGNSVTLNSYIMTQTDLVKQELSQGTATHNDMNEYLGSVLDSGEMIQDNLIKVDLMLQKFKTLADSTTLSDVQLFNVCEYLTFTISRVRTLYSKYSIQVIVSCPQNLEFNSDPIKFSQVISNLLTNSYQHGFLEDDEGIIKITITKTPEFLNISYSDNGEGIPESRQNDLFSPSFSDKFNKVSGLGLNMVYNLVTTAFRGSITYDSKPGYGLEFKLLLRENDLRDELV